MNKKLYWLTPLIATVIQLVLSAIILFIYEMIFPPKQPDLKAPVLFSMFVFFGFGAIETAIGYFVSWLYTIQNRNRNMVLLIYAIIYCAISIGMAILISDSRFENDVLHWILFFMIPAILYLIPYIYGTVRFYNNETANKEQ